MLKKQIFILSLVLLTSSFIQAQMSHAQWKQSIKKISDCEYDLIYTVTIDKGWHIPSKETIKGAEDETFPTSVVFSPGTGYSLVGKLTESKPVSEYDATLKRNIFLHYNYAVFTQRIRLNSSAKIKISGTYEYQICDNKACNFPPKDVFNFELQGTAACQKK